jgi:hypothetical protein
MSQQAEDLLRASGRSAASSRAGARSRPRRDGRHAKPIWSTSSEYVCHSKWNSLYESPRGANCTPHLTSTNAARPDQPAGIHTYRAEPIPSSQVGKLRRAQGTSQREAFPGGGEASAPIPSVSPTHIVARSVSRTSGSGPTEACVGGPTAQPVSPPGCHKAISRAIEHEGSLPYGAEECSRQLFVRRPTTSFKNDQKPNQPLHIRRSTTPKSTGTATTPR